MRTTRVAMPRTTYYTSAVGISPKPNTLFKFEAPVEATTGEGGGYRPRALEIKVRTPDIDPNIYKGPSLFDYVAKWWQGGGNKPPEVEVEVTEPKPEEIDTSGCMLAFAHAVASVIKTAAGKAKERADYNNASADERGARPEPEGVTLGNAHSDLNQAVKDFGDCLRKGMSEHEAFVKICQAEAKSMVEDMIKDRFQTKGKMAAFQARVTGLAKAQNAEIARIRKQQGKYAVDLIKEAKEINVALREAHVQITKQLSSLGNIFQGATKEYTDIVKKSDGLTRVLPSVVKALEACAKLPDDKALAAATKALADQKTAIQKGVTKGDKDAEKAAKTLIASLEAFEKKWIG
jgi:hypothetical protein